MRLKKKQPIPGRESARPKLNSPESKAITEAVKLAIAIPDPKGPYFGSAFLELARDCELPGGNRGALLLARLRQLEAGIHRFRERYRERFTRDPDCVPGWSLQASYVREIGDTLAAFRLVAGDLAGDDLRLRDCLIESCKVRITELEKSLAAELSLSPEQARTMVEQLFGDLITTREVLRLAELKGFKAWQQTQRLEGNDARRRD
jgi:hypothetical protein